MALPNDTIYSGIDKRTFAATVYGRCRVQSANSRPLIKDVIQQVAKEFGLSTVPRSGTVGRWADHNNVPRLHNRPSCVEDRVNILLEFVKYNYCGLHVAGKYIAEQLGLTYGQMRSAEKYIVNRKSKVVYVERPCRMCGEMFAPTNHYAAGACPECVTKYGRRYCNSWISETAHGGTRVPIPIANRIRQRECVLCGTTYSPEKPNGGKVGMRCVKCQAAMSQEDFNTERRRWKTVTTCTTCGRYMYTSNPACEMCLTRYTIDNRKRIRAWAAKGKKYCLCGNWYFSGFKFCARCIDLLHQDLRKTWQNATTIKRCAHCYATMLIDDPDRFCGQCLSQHSAAVLTQLCLTEQMCEAADVKRYNQKFMRTHTLRMKRIAAFKGHIPVTASKCRKPKPFHPQSQLIEELCEAEALATTKTKE